MNTIYTRKVFQKLTAFLHGLHITAPLRLTAVCALCWAGMEAYPQSPNLEQIYIETTLERIRSATPDTALARQQAAQFLEQFESFRSTVRQYAGKTETPGAVVADKTARSSGVSMLAAPVSFNWYVSTTGSDSNSGTSAAAPLRTVGKAIEKASHEHVIRIEPGVYTECLYISGKTVTLTGNPNGPSTVVLNAQQNGTAIHAKSRVNIYGLTITEGHSLSDAGSALYLDGGAAFLYESVITGNSGQNVISSSSAISAYSTLIMQNCLIHSNLTDGLVLNLSRCTAVLRNTTIADNRAWASAVINEDCNSYFTNCILYNPAVPSQELSFHPYSINYLYYNNIHKFSNLQGIGGPVIQSDNIDSIPRFVSRSNRMYQLAENSYCIDRGDPQEKDSNRPPARGGVRSDMGAYGGDVSMQPYQVAPADGNDDPYPDPVPVPDPVVAFNVNSAIPKSVNWVYTVYPQTATGMIADTRGDDYKQEIAYLDGFGRPLQTVDIAASPDRKDIVTPVEYDGFGREAKKYLPYEAATGTGTYRVEALSSSGGQKTWYSNAHTGIPADTRPFAETVFEISPLNRIAEQYGPGQAWKTSNKRQRTAYGTNAANDVRLWKATRTEVKSSAYYAAGTLYVTVTTDEDNCTTVEYRDMQNRTVKQRQILPDGSWTDTDYAYDEFGRKAYVLPPAVPKHLDLTIGDADPYPWFYHYVYAYRYDGRGREAEKHIPGAGWTWTVYNKLGMPVAVQDVEQRSRGEWSFTKYDAHGRVVMTGLLTDNAASQAAMQAKVDAVAVLWETRTAGQDYPGNSFPAAGYTLLSVSYYDDYDFPGNPFTGTSDRPHGLPTGGKTRVLGSSPEQWLFSAVYYDQKGRVVRSVSQQLAQSGTVNDETVNEYDFTGRITRSERKITVKQ